ncbi:MAG: hypothetical protein NDI77_12390 [Geobacteraceae bacterium]|nr:hypothetical protein [Geobacteraceae bacterium]
MKTRRWLTALAALAVVLLATAVAFGAEAPRISKEDARAALENKQAVVLDVRAGRDWNKSDHKIAGAVREEPAEVEKWAGKYLKDKELILYCA